MRVRNFIVILLILALQIGFLAGGEIVPANPMGILRLLVAAACILYIPGYSLLAALMPRPASLNSIQRMAISSVASVAILPVIALILSPLQWGLRPWPMGIAISTFTLITALIGVIRYARLRVDQRHTDPETSFRAWWQPASRTAKALFAAMLVIVIIGLFLTILSLATPHPDSALTEFYITGDQGIAELYPLEAAPGETLVLHVTISNHEGRSMTYSVLVMIDGAAMMTSQPLILADGQVWSRDINLTMPETTSLHRVELRLLCEDRPSPCRTLIMQINVR